MIAKIKQTRCTKCGDINKPLIYCSKCKKDKRTKKNPLRIYKNPEENATRYGRIFHHKGGIKAVVNTVRKECTKETRSIVLLIAEHYKIDKKELQEVLNKHGY